MTNTIDRSSAPLVIEAAVTPYRPGTPLQTPEEMVAEAKACLAAGAAIVHHHHDFRLRSNDAVRQIIDIEHEILTDYPEALLYADYLRGDTVQEKYAYLEPLAEAGLLSMFALDPGHTMFDIPDENGLPSRFAEAGFTFTECNEMVDFAHRAGVPISFGIYEAGHLRWVRAYAAAGKVPRGSLIKLYLPDEYSLGGTPRVGVGLYPTIASVDLYVSMLEDTGTAWQVSVPGGVILDTPVARYALERGGHIRVGIEDTGGRTPMTNAETVCAAVELAEKVGRRVVQGDEARAALAAG
jgi:3-keto-5-aminohexanoate cleavage enzyme